ncbi:ComEA family DNA-binding protein [Hazenella coriacea]|uniref:Helix-hairpin-helix protein n=1 Tax=Hazenella coriacea TaxID=1179467 RepID=A0A4R3LBD3_9BACL|nr:helix-hairpin-helix domain-containing protein [Hazenella coriacea]TCS96608.1 helix-hairpin-helix protein [Hazenella coriacea]
MSITNRGQKWEWLNSIWILWTFAFGFFSWISFFYIGFRTKQTKWIISGIIYAIPFILAMIFMDGDNNPNNDHWMVNVTAGLTLFLGIIAIVHAFLVRKEYLLRLSTIKANKINQNEALKRKIEAEYGNRVQPTHQPNQSHAHLFEEKKEPTSFSPNHHAVESSSTIPPNQSPINLNLASEEMIASLPGIGTVLARAAIQHRQYRGGFQSLEEFAFLLQLKPHIVERIRPLVVVTPIYPKQPSSHGRMVDY